MSNVPKLRFKEFSGEWEKIQLGKLGSFQGGGTPSTANEEYWNGNIPWISSSDIIDEDIININITRYINEKAVKESATKIIPKNSILFVSRVGVGKVAISQTDLCTSQDFTNLTLSNNNSYFVGYYFLSKRNLLIRYSQGTSIKGFTTGDIKTLKLNIPSIQEQEKIATFLTSVDTKIEQLSRKEELLKEYKKGVMQKIFSGELRFKADDDENREAKDNSLSLVGSEPKRSESEARSRVGKEFPEWEEKKLGDIGKVSMCKRILKHQTSEHSDIPFYKIGTFGKIADAYIDNNLYENYKEKYSFPNKGDILISASGTIGRTVVYDGEPAYFQDSNIVWISNNEKLVKNAFLVYFYETVKWTTEDTTIARLYNDNLRNINIGVPCLEEQTKIANFLSSIDTKIEQVSAQLDSSKEFKKALLQQMFA